MSSEHTSVDFETELRELRARALDMGTACERAVAIAVDAIRQGPSETARQVLKLEKQTDRDEVDVTAMVLRILALRQPVARDLRFLTAVLKLVTDLERISDEAVRLTERSLEADGRAGALFRDELEPMATLAQGILREALRAFFEENAESAKRALESDGAVDAQYNAIVAMMSERMSTRSVEAVNGMLVVRIAKHLERIAGHATNVAEEAIFVLTGEDVRHSHTAARSAS